ncbi:MAG: SRPBCC family protein [Pirellulales bacterium]
MFKKILLVFLVLIVGFVVYVALQPADFEVKRTAVIDAPPEVVFAQVNDFHNWEAWSPWAKLDPNAKATFAGPDAGKGASFHWNGNAEVGEGTQTILESDPHEKIKIQLDFKKPMESSCVTDFTFTPVEGKTKVEWKMSGQNNFVGRAFCVFMNMDKMVGGQFEEGLASLNKVVTTQPNAATPVVPAELQGK